MKRNIDEIKRLNEEVKRLNYEIGRRDKKIADQQVELTKAKKEVNLGIEQLKDIFHSVLVSMALTYGKEAPEGTYTIEMPVGHTTGNKLNFDVDIKRTDYDTSVVTVTEKTKDKEAGGNG
jgi:hypothetical protein